MYKKITRTFVSLCLSFCLLGLLPLRAAAWGRDGHQIVAGIAIARLRQMKAQNALNNISAILKGKPETPMLRQPKDVFAASVWPDDVRGSKEYSFADNLHFVSILLDKRNPSNERDRYDEGRDCRASTKIPEVPEGVCIIGALEHYSKMIATSTSKKARLEALGFLIHFMGDVHQPLHTSEDKSFTNQLGKKGDRGGNFRFIFYLADSPFLSDDIASCLEEPDVCTESFSDERSNRKLHAAWDKYMIRTEMERNPRRPSFLEYGKDLFNSMPKNPLDPLYAEIEAGNFTQWAEETHDVAEKNAYDLKGPKTKISPEDNEQFEFFLLDEAYRAKNIKIVDRQLLRAGIRLAAVLRQIFPGA